MSAPGPQGPVIRLEAVSKVFPDVPPGTPPALQDVTADIPAGRVVGLVGPDAAGKTTLMRLLAGPLLPTSGRVEVLGRAPGDSAFRRSGASPRTQAGPRRARGWNGGVRAGQGAFGVVLGHPP